MLVRQPLLYGWRQEHRRLKIKLRGKSSAMHTPTAVFCSSNVYAISAAISDPLNRLLHQVIIPPPQHPSSHCPAPVRPIRQTSASGPLRAFQPQGHTLSTPLKPPSTPFPSATDSARSTAPALPACSARLFRSRRLDQQSKAHAIRHHVAAPRSLPLPASEPSVEFAAVRTGAAA